MNSREKQRRERKNTAGLQGDQMPQAGHVMPPWAAASLIFLWAAAVLYFYLKAYPFSFEVIAYYFSNNFPEPFSALKLLAVSVFSAASVFPAALIFISANGLGKIILKALHAETGDAGEKFVIDTAAGLAALMLFVTAAGMAGVLDARVIVPVLAALGLYNAYLTAVNIKAAGVRHWAEALRFYSQPAYAKILLLACLGIGAAGSLAPETFYDAISYHITVAQHWVNEGAIRTIFGYHSSYIVTYIHTLYAVALMLGNEISAKFMNLAFAVMSIMALLAICRRHFGSGSGTLAAVFFFTVPVAVIVSTRVGLEYPLAFMELTAVYFGLRLFDEANTVKDDAKWAALTGAFIGISVASKYTSAGAAAGMAAGIAYHYLFGRKLRRLLIALPVMAITAAAVFSPWVVRNIMQTGHPLYPFVFNESCTGLNMIVHGRKDPMNDMAPVRPGAVSKITLPWEITMGAVGQEPYIGPAFLIFLPLLFLLKKPDRKIRFILVYCLVYYLFWAVVGRPYLRYFIPALAVLSIAYGYALSSLGQSPRKYLVWLLVSAAFMNIVFAMGVQKNIQDPLGVITGMQSRSDYLSTQRPSYVSPYYGAAAWINDNLPADAKVMIFCDPRGYYIKRDFVVNLQGDYCPLIETVKEEMNPAGIYQRLKKEGVTHLMINSNELKRTPGYDSVYWEAGELAVFHEFWKKHIRLVHYDIADIAMPNRGIFSMKKQQPQWWQGYSSDFRNYIYVYEILNEQSAGSRPVPPDILLLKDYYPEKRWEKLKNTAEKLAKG